jgi:uncharacterized membrane protein YqjE
MELDSSQGTRASKPSSLGSIQDLVAFFVRYLELRLQLFGLESREAGFHLLILALLFVSVLVCFGGFVIMSVVFLLYLMMLILEPLGKLWRKVWQFSKPMIAAYLAKLLAEQAKSSETRDTRTEWLKTESPKRGINGRRR